MIPAFATTAGAAFIKQSPRLLKLGKALGKDLIALTAVDVTVHTVFRAVTMKKHLDGITWQDKVRNAGVRAWYEVMDLGKFTAGSACTALGFLGYIPTCALFAVGMVAQSTLMVGAGLAALVAATVGSVFTESFEANSVHSLAKKLYIWIAAHGFDVLTWPAKISIIGQMKLIRAGNKLRRPWSISRFVDSFKVVEVDEDLRETPADVHVTEAYARRALAEVTTLAERNERNPLPEGFSYDFVLITEAPKDMGRAAFAQVFEKHGIEVADKLRRRMIRDLRNAEVPDSVRKLFVSGFDDARVHSHANAGS